MLAYSKIVFALSSFLTDTFCQIPEGLRILPPFLNKRFLSHHQALETQITFPQPSSILPHALRKHPESSRKYAGASSILTEGLGIFAQPLSILPEWSGKFPQPPSKLAQWVRKIAQWSGKIAQAPTIIAQCLRKFFRRLSKFPQESSKFPPTTRNYNVWLVSIIWLPVQFKLYNSKFSINLKF
jgi:hypothetical protein